MKDPGCAQLSDVGAIDFAQAAEAASGVVAVIRRPVLAHGLGQQDLLAVTCGAELD